MAMAARKHDDTASQYATDAQRWAAVQARDANADDLFYYAVRTTGVFCRPSCAARPAKRSNVTFHTTIAAAQKAGFRPCKRCKPDEATLRAKQTQLIAGRVMGDKVEILQGLNEGENIITSGQINLADGSKISPIK